MLEHIRKGLNGFQLKIIALFFMTVDHIGAHQVLTASREVNELLRILGRIAAPLFLFLLVEGLRHTRNKTRYMLRLYAAGVLVAIGNKCFIELFAAEYVPPLGNILPTFFYIALFVICIDLVRKAARERRYTALIVPVAGMVVPFICAWIYGLCTAYSEPLGSFYDVAVNALRILAPSPFMVEYSFIFIALGVLWYFVNNKLYNCAIFAALCVLSAAVDISFVLSIPFFPRAFFTFYHMFADIQWFMFLAIPFILLYNGAKGGGLKYLFYVYYPLHQYALALISLYTLANR